MKSPSDAVIAVTSRCNGRCAMCNIWKSSLADELQPEHLRKLPRELKTINLSGGEPFLRADLGEFVREARRRCPAATITISTNAIQPQRIEEMMREIRSIDPSVRLAVSLDGLAAAHDRIRGAAGAFGSAMTLIDRLTADGYRNLRLGMTLWAENLDQFAAVAELAADRGLELGVVAAHNAATHLGVENLPAGPIGPDLRRQFRRVLAGWLRSWKPRQWLRAHFAWLTYRFLTGRPWRFGCRAGEDFFFLRSDGELFSCSVKGQPMGNIVSQEWPEIWGAPAADRARDFSRKCRENCWMICTARSVYRSRRRQVVFWIAGRKILAHLGWYGNSQRQRGADTSH